jgi:hypothetical protein
MFRFPRPLDSIQAVLCRSRVVRNDEPLIKDALVEPVGTENVIMSVELD